MSDQTRNTCQIIGSLLLMSAVLILFVPAANIWPWVFLFGSVGLGLLVGPVSSRTTAVRSNANPQP